MLGHSYAKLSLRASAAGHRATDKTILTFCNPNVSQEYFVAAAAQQLTFSGLLNYGTGDAAISWQQHACSKQQSS
jgi:hypothetical protein